MGDTIIVHLLLANDVFIIKGGFIERKRIGMKVRGKHCNLVLGLQCVSGMLIYLHLIHPAIG